jgi:hypothetical protein
MSSVNGFFSTMLPNMWTKYFSARSKDDMSTSMVISKLNSSSLINLTCNNTIFIMFCAFRKWFVKLMHHNFTNLLDINNIIINSINIHHSNITLLTTSIRVESCLVKNNQVHSHILLNISKYIYKLSFTIVNILIFTMLMEKMFSFR